MEIQRVKKRNNSIKIELKALSNFLNPKKRAKHKVSHYSPILQGYMNTRSGGEESRIFEPYWTAEEVQQLLWVR